MEINNLVHHIVSHQNYSHIVITKFQHASQWLLLACLRKRKMSRQSLSTKRLTEVTLYAHTYMEKKCIQASQINALRLCWGPVHSRGVVRRGWKELLHCGPLCSERSRHHCMAALLSFWTWGSAHALQTCLLNLDSLQAAKALGVR